MFLLFTILMLLVVLVNGWTDAPSAIANCVSTRALPPARAITLAALCNLVGAIGMALLNPSVALTLFGLVDFGEGGDGALTALCAALCAVILWAVAAWRFGLPTSESHALISAMTGAALARRVSTDVFCAEEWRAVLFGLVLTTLPAFLLGFLFYRGMLFALRRCERRRTVGYFLRAQCVSAAGSALLHGAQDSQKFMGVFLLGMSLSGVGGAESVGNPLPISVILVCAAVMTLGTMLGGTRIIKKVGLDMTHPDAAAGSAADAASTAVLALCSLLGYPAGTTHAKACAVMGTGAGKRGGINSHIALQMLAVWALTFPLCGILGFVFSHLFSYVFSILTIGFS